MDLHTRYPGESEGLNNWIARETTTVPMSRYSRLHSAMHEAPSALPSVSDLEEGSHWDFAKLSVAMPQPI